MACPERCRDSRRTIILYSGSERSRATSCSMAPAPGPIVPGNRRCLAYRPHPHAALHRDLVPNGLKELCNVLLCIGIVISAQLGKDRSRLVCRHSRTSSECHVLLRMGHAWESRRSFVATGQKIQINAHHWRQRVPNHDHPQAILQSGPRYIVLHLCRQNYGRKPQEHDNRNNLPTHTQPHDLTWRAYCRLVRKAMWIR